jgi:hypothetical protein
MHVCAPSLKGIYTNRKGALRIWRTSPYITIGGCRFYIKYRSAFGWDNFIDCMWIKRTSRPNIVVKSSIRRSKVDNFRARRIPKMWRKCRTALHREKLAFLHQFPGTKAENSRKPRTSVVNLLSIQEFTWRLTRDVATRLTDALTYRTNSIYSEEVWRVFRICKLNAPEPYTLSSWLSRLDRYWTSRSAATAIDCTELYKPVQYRGSSLVATFSGAARSETTARCNQLHPLASLALGIFEGWRTPESVNIRAFFITNLFGSRRLKLHECFALKATVDSQAVGVGWTLPTSRTNRPGPIVRKQLWG